MSYKFQKYFKNPAKLHYFCKYSKFIGVITRKILSIQRVFFSVKVHVIILLIGLNFIIDSDAHKNMLHIILRIIE